MLRLPVRPLAGALIGALMFSLTSMLGAAQASTEPTDPRAAIELDTDLTLNIAKCEGCTVQLFSYDGVNPGYSSQVATVTAGSVTITIPSEKTAGMSVRIVPTWLTTPVAADTQVVWRFAGEAIGAPVSLKAARSKKRASGCWAGTVNEAVSLTVKVRRVTYRGRPGAIAWAPVTESFLPPMQKVRRGVLVSDDMLACTLYG